MTGEGGPGGVGGNGRPRGHPLVKDRCGRHLRGHRVLARAATRTLAGDDRSLDEELTAPDARDAQRAEEDYAELGVDSGRFPARVSPLCQWCDFRAHCPAGQAAGPEKSGWAALEGEE